MKNIFAILLLICTLFLFGCQKVKEGNNNNILPTPIVEPTSIPYQEPIETLAPMITNEDVIENAINHISGTFEVKSLFSTDRNTNEEYVLKNNDVLGKSLVINDSNMIYDGEIYLCIAVAERNAYELSTLFNLPTGQASVICGGDISGNEYETRKGKVQTFNFENKDTKKGFFIFQKPDGILLLNLNEGFEYWGIYELSNE